MSTTKKILSSEVYEVLHKDEKISDMIYTTATELTKKHKLTDVEVLAFAEGLSNLVYGILKEEGVELINDSWE